MSAFAEIATDILRIRPHVPENLMGAFDRVSEGALQQAIGRAVETPAHGIARTSLDARLDRLDELLGVLQGPTLALIQGGRDAS